jgi:heme exporter protein D
VATALCAEQVWTTVAIGGLVMLVALISGVWARLDILAQRAQSQRN